MEQLQNLDLLVSSTCYSSGRWRDTDITPSRGLRIFPPGLSLSIQSFYSYEECMQRTRNQRWFVTRRSSYLRLWIWVISLHDFPTPVIMVWFQSLSICVSKTPLLSLPYPNTYYLSCILQFSEFYALTVFPLPLLATTNPTSPLPTPHTSTHLNRFPLTKRQIHSNFSINSLE